MAEWINTGSCSNSFAEILLSPIVKAHLHEINLRIYFANSGSAVSACAEKGYLDLMPTSIRSSILRYKRRQDRQATLFGKLLLLEALQNLFDDAGIEKFQTLDATPDGKPFIPGGPEFNISHSHEVVVLAVAERCSVGIDIEKIRPVNIDDFSGYLPEVANLRETDDPDLASRIFFDCWTKKEAVMKGDGKGLLAPLEQVVLKDDKALFYQTAWFINKVPVDDGYCCHVATDKPPGDIVVKKVDLVNGAGYLRKA